MNESWINSSLVHNDTRYVFPLQFNNNAQNIIAFFL